MKYQQVTYIVKLFALFIHEVFLVIFLFYFPLFVCIWVWGVGGILLVVHFGFLGSSPYVLLLSREGKTRDDGDCLNFSSHYLQNYSSIITVHPKVIDGRPGTMVVESFVVDVPDGNTKDETCYFVEALIRCNLKSLADVSERLAVQGHMEPIDRM